MSHTYSISNQNKKASFEVENVFFMDSSFIPKADYFKKLKSVGANLFQVPFAEQPEMSRIMIDSYLEYGKELIEGTVTISSILSSIFD